MFKKLITVVSLLTALPCSSSYAAMDLVVDSAHDLKELYDDGFLAEPSENYPISKKSLTLHSGQNLTPTNRSVSIFGDLSDLDEAANVIDVPAQHETLDVSREKRVLRILAQPTESVKVSLDPSKLQGVVFLQNEGLISEESIRSVYQQSLSTGKQPIQTIGISSAALLAALDSAAEDIGEYIGRPINLELIDDIIGLVKQSVRMGNIPFANVYSPPQNIREGLIYLVVNPSLVDDVRIASSKYSNEERLLGKISQKIGEPINIDALNHELAALSLHPDRSINASFSSGGVPNSTSIDLDIYEQKPWRVYAALFNSGSQDLDRENFSIGGYHNNILGLDHKASYQYTSSVDRQSLKAHNLSYEVPLFDTHSLFLQYSKSNTEVELLDGTFETEGGFTQQGAHYGAAFFDELKLADGWSLSDHKVSLGVDRKDIKGDILFALFGDPIDTGIGADVEVINAVLGYKGKLTDPYGGVTALNTSLVYSPGGLSSRNKADDFRTARSGVDAEYMYGRFSAKRSQPINWKFLEKNLTFVSGVEGQVSADRLIGSERFVNFYRQGFRGYNSGVMSGDSGIASFVELVSGSYSVIPDKYWKDSLSASVFSDFGVFYDKDSLENEEGRQGYLSVGASLKYRINDQIDSELTFAQSLSGQDDDKGQQVMYKLLLGY